MEAAEAGLVTEGSVEMAAETAAKETVMAVAGSAAKGAGSVGLVATGCLVVESEEAAATVGSAEEAAATAGSTC